MATYNCSDSSNSAYGAGGYGTCNTVGAPDTGYFSQVLDSASFTIVAPVVTTLVLALIASLIVRRRKKSAGHSAN